MKVNFEAEVRRFATSGRGFEHERRKRKTLKKKKSEREINSTKREEEEKKNTKRASLKETPTILETISGRKKRGVKRGTTVG